VALNLVPGRSFEIPIAMTAGQTLSITTSSPSKEIYDSIAVLLASDGTPMIGADDDNKYFAAFNWIAPASGTYRLWVTSFESVNTGELVVRAPTEELLRSSPGEPVGKKGQVHFFEDEK
jgi:hypothetical protein